MKRAEMTEEAKEKLREYNRQYRAKNKEKFKQYQVNYWNKKANGGK